MGNSMAGIGTDRDISNIVGQFNSAETEDFLQLFIANYNRCLFATQSGLVGLGPPTVEKGDVCCILNVARVPSILRHRADLEGSFELVGECLLPRVIHGEAVQMLERGDVQEQMFTIY